MASIEEDFPWLEGILDYTREWGRDLMTDVVDPLTGRLVRSALGDFNTGIPVMQAATQAATQAANTSAAGLGALAALPYGGVDRTAEALRRRTDPTNPNYNPLIPTYQAPPEAQGPLQGLATLARPVADAGPALGNLAFEATGSPALATGAHIGPEALLLAFGVNPSLRSTRIGRGKVEYDELFPDPRALPEPKSDLFDVKGPTGRGGPGKYEEGAIRITNDDPENPEYGGIMGGWVNPAVEDLVRSKKNPAGMLVPSIEDALSGIQRSKPAPGSTWYKELTKAGVAPAELAYFELDTLKDSSTPITREEITQRVDESENQIKALRAGTGTRPVTTGPVPDELAEGKRLTEMGPEFYAEELPDTIESKLRAVMPDPDFEQLLEDYDYPRELESLLSSLSPMAQKSRNRPFQRDFINARSDFESTLRSYGVTDNDISDVLDPLADMSAKQFEYSKWALEDRRNRDARVGPINTPQFHHDYKIKTDVQGDLTTRFGQPESEYGYPDVRGYGGGMESESGGYPHGLRGRYPDLIKDEKPVSHFTNITAKEKADNASRLFDASHKRESYVPVPRKFGTYNKRGELTHDLARKISESQGDPVQKAHNKGGLGLLFPLTKADFERLKEGIPAELDKIRLAVSDAMMGYTDSIDREYARRESGELSHEQWNALERRLVRDRNKNIEGLRAKEQRLNEERKDLEDRRMLGLPETSHPSDRLFSSLHAKTSAVEGIREGVAEWLTAPSAREQALANNYAFEWNNLVWDPEDAGWVNDKGEHAGSTMTELLNEGISGWPDFKLPEGPAKEAMEKGKRAYTEYLEDAKKVFEEKERERLSRTVGEPEDVYYNADDDEYAENYVRRFNDATGELERMDPAEVPGWEKIRAVAIKDRWGDPRWKPAPEGTTRRDVINELLSRRLNEVDTYELKRAMIDEGKDFYKYAMERGATFDEPGYAPNQKAIAWTTKNIETNQDRMMQDMVRQLGLDKYGGKVTDVPTPGTPGFPHTTRGVQITPEMRKGVESGEIRVPLFDPVVKKAQQDSKAKASKPNPGKIIAAYRQGKISKEEATQQLLSARVPADRIGNMLR